MKKHRAPRATPKTVPSPARAPTYDDLLAIARLVESGSRFTEFRLRSGDIEVEVKRANGAAPGWAPEPSLGTGAGPAAPPADNPVASAQPTAAARVPELPAGAHVIRSPMVGTFYRAAEPGAKPFVETGTKVKPDSIVCIIEVMKLMNSVEAGVKGTVTHVLAENAALVGQGQPLIAIRPE